MRPGAQDALDVHGFGAQIGKALAEMFDAHEGPNDMPFPLPFQGFGVDACPPGRRAPCPCPPARAAM
ncbi:hypothetical protein GCM10007933_19580 [Zoogloea oryzae]|uniref:Uncharacterized protein n=1 Tax=Zoogloea oryzae TaxID=310767 RepID=A0ABQ6FAB8_9RHOO|nr:hypothetical protein GCM10007933_19580 [Zoogloea oryzae]